jgi:hypothetical protein
MREKRPPAAERIESRMETPAGSSENLRKRKVRLREVIDILNERGVEPIGAICDVLPQLDPSLQARTLLSLAEFVYPKLGRTEYVGEGGGPIQTINRVELVPLSGDRKG